MHFKQEFVIVQKLINHLLSSLLLVFCLDPFASVTSPPSVTDHSTPPASNSKVVTSLQHEPQLFVPPASPNNQSKTSSAPSENPVPPVPSISTSDTSNVSKANPYSRASAGGHRPRPMFPSNQQFFQTSSPNTSILPNIQPPYPGSTPPAPAMDMSKIVNQPSSEAPSVGMTTPPPPPSNSQLYQPVLPHWFYCKNAERSSVWSPFSHADSSKLEMLFQAGKHNEIYRRMYIVILQLILTNLL